MALEQSRFGKDNRVTNARALSGPLTADEQEQHFVRELKARLPNAWERLFNDHYERMVRYIVVRVRNVDESEDMASNVFLRALKNIDSYRYTGKPVVAWLYGIAQNLIRERLRKVKQETTFNVGEALMSLGRASDGASGSLSHVERLDLERAIARLTPLQQEVLALRYVAGFRGREVASMLGRSERAIYYVEARGLVSLRGTLGVGLEMAGGTHD